MNLREAFFAVSLPVIAAASGFAGGDSPPPNLNPQTYVSPSGVYALKIDPSDLHGKGPGDYRFTKDGKAIWEIKLPYTFWEAVVADSGHVMGYAYTAGKRGKDSSGTFVVASLSPDGKVLNEEKQTRKVDSSRIFWGYPYPLANGLIFDATKKRFVIRFDDPDFHRGIERWRVFDMETGKELASLEPQESMPKPNAEDGVSIIGAKAVPCTPLVLTHWWKSSPHSSGALFTLHDLDHANAKPIWTFTIDGDYSVSGKANAESADAPDDDARASEEEIAVRMRVLDEGAILDVNKSPGFVIRTVKQNQKIAFEIEKNKNGDWRVHEIERTPYEPKPRPVSPQPPELALKEMASVPLQIGEKEPESPIRDISRFDFDAKGNICILRTHEVEDNTEGSLLYVTQEGEVLKTFGLSQKESPPFIHFAGPVNVGGGKFVVIGFDGGRNPKGTCFTADFASGSIVKSANLDLPFVRNLISLPDGRFAALGRASDTEQSYDSLYIFDGHGKILRQINNYGALDETQELSAVTAITRYDVDSIAALTEENRTVPFSLGLLTDCRDRIRIFDAKGNFVRSIDLSKSWRYEMEHEMDRLLNIAGEADDGFVILGMSLAGRSALTQFNAKGKVINQTRLALDDGRPTGSNLCRSPDGRWWTCNRNLLVRLSENGSSDRVLGAETNSKILSDPSLIVVDGKDRIYIADDQTTTVHVFDGTGTKVGVCVPNWKNIKNIRIGEQIRDIAASPNGDVFISFYSNSEGFAECVRFNKEFKQTGIVKLALNEPSYKLCFSPFSNLCWALGDENVYLLSNMEQVSRKITRRADGRWLEWPDSIGVAPNGNVVISAWSQTREASLNTYNAQGEPLSTFVFPKDWTESWRFFSDVAYDGKTIYSRFGNKLFLIGPNNRCVGACILPFIEDESTYKNLIFFENGKFGRGPYIAAQGTQLWFIDREKMLILKYALPQPK